MECANEIQSAPPSITPANMPVRICAFSFRFILKVVVSAAVALAVGTTAYGQELEVTSAGGVEVSNGSEVAIDQNPLMPPLTLAVPGGATACDGLSWAMQITWSGTAPTDIPTNAALSGEFPCNQTYQVDWTSVGYAGGTTTITWSALDDCGNTLGSGTLSFTIFGTNPPTSAVDSLIPSAPWFWENMIAWESRAYSLGTPITYHQFLSAGTPLDCECPTGVGLTQLDPPNSVLDYWDWPQNEVDGYNVLASDQTPATNAWNNEFNQMVQTTAGSPVYPPTTSFPPNCTFMYPVNGGHSYVDANWIKMYNTGPGLSGGVYSGAFIFWDPPTGTTVGFWDPEDTSRNYVQNVCQSNAL